MKNFTRSVIAGKTLSSKKQNSKKNARGISLMRTILSGMTLLFSVAVNAQYCVPVTNNGCTAFGDQYAAFSTSGGITNINHNPGTTCDGNANGDASFSGPGLSASAFPGTLMGFSITNNAGAAEGYAIWIDWNHNNTFEASEEVYASPGTIAPGALATGTFTVPAGAVLGTTDLRIRCRVNSVGTTLSPCATYSLPADGGIAFDFPFTVAGVTFNNGSPQSLQVCEGSGANSITSLLTASDVTGFTLTWTQTAAPSHGGLAGLPTTAPSGANVSPLIAVYVPSPFYSGPDAFTVQVSDGTTTATTVVNVTVNATPVISGSTFIVCGTSSTPLGLSAGTTGGTWSSSSIFVTVGSSSGIITGVAPGTSTITYSSPGGGCTATQVVTDNPTPVITGTTSFIVCGTNSTTLGISPGVTGGAWSSSSTFVTVGAGSGTITGVAPGTSTITYTTAGAGCTATQAVTDNSVPVITGTTSFIVCGTNSTTLGISPGIAGGTWSSSSTFVTVGSGSGTITGVAPGTSTITYVTRGAGCTNTQVVTDNPTPVITGTTSFIVCGTNSTTLAISPGITGGTWSSSSTFVTVGPSSGTITGVAPGTSTITYTTPGAGCSATQVVTDNSVPVITGTTSFIVCGTNSTTLGISPGITGGAWSSSSTFVTVGAGSGTITGVAPGTSTITYVTPGAGCTTTQVVTDNPVPVITGTSSFIVCGTNSTTLGISPGITGGTWSSSSTFVSVGVGSGIITGVLPGTSTITYTTPGAGCTATQVVTDNPVPVINGNTSFIVCGTNSTTLSISPGITGGTWSSSSTFVTVGAGSGTITGVAPGTSAITYVTPGAGCTTTQVATDNPTPVITGSTSFIVCGTSSTTLGVSPGITGGTWSSSSTFVTVGAGSGTITGVAPGTGTITYVTPGAGCTAIQVVTDNPTPVINGTTSFIVCATNSTTLVISPGITGGTWSSSSTFVTVGSSSGTITGVAPGTSTITYSTPGAGCTVTQVVTDNPTPVITGTTSFIVCGTNSTTLAISPGITGGTWSSGNTSDLTIGLSTGILTGVLPGTSTITYTTPGAGCTNTQVVTDNPTPVITGTTSFIVCGTNATTLAISPGITGGTWSSSSTFVTVGASSGTITGIAPGTSTITYTTPGAGCTATKVVTDNSVPVITGTTSFIVCGTNSTTLGISPGIAGGAWSSSSTFVTVGAGSGTITGVAPGTSTITYVTPGAGCTTTQVVTDNTTPVITGTTSFIVCGTNSTTLGISPGITGGTWSSSSTFVTVGAGSGTITGVAPGTSTITYTTPGAGCIATQVVTDNPVPVITGTTSFIVCGTNSTTLGISPGITGGTWSSSSTFVTVGAGSGTITGVAPGTSTITYVTPGAGCSNTQIVTDNTTPVITGTTSFIVCGTNSTTLGISPGITGGTWSSSSTFVTVGASSGTVTGVAPGTSTITYTTPGAGCSATQVVTDNSVPVITSTTSFIVCGTNSTTLGISPGITGGTWSSSSTFVTVGASSGTITGVAPGTSTITYITPGAGCTAAQVVTDNSTPVITGTTSFIVCGTNSTTLGISPGITGGTWSSSSTFVTVGASSGTITGVASGTSAITYTTPGAGCTATQVVTDNPVPVITGTTSFIVCATNSTTLGISPGITGGTWSSSSTFVTVGSSSGTITGVAPGTSTITYLTTGAGCTATQGVTDNPTPVISGVFAVCGTSTTTLVLSAGITGGTWTSSTTFVTVGTSSGIITGVAPGTSTITYTTPGSGCTATQVVTENPLPAAIGGNYACLGETLTLTDASTGGTWSSNNTAQATIGSTSGIITGLILGTTPTITYTLPTGCFITNVITVSSLPSGAYVVIGGGTYCAGTAGVNIGLNESAGGVNYQLYNGPSPIGSPVPGTYAVLSFGNQTSPGSYTVLGTNAITGCYNTQTGSVTVSINPAPVVYTLSGGGTYCAGGTGFHVLLSGSGLGINYQLYLNSVSTGGLVAGTGTVLDMGLKTAAGIYTIVAINATTACTSNMTGSVTITINPGPAVNNVIGTGGYCAGGTGVVIGLNGSVAGASYQLYKNGISFGVPVVSAGGAFNFGLETTGTYTVIATNTTTGCTSTMAGSAIVSVNPLPTVYPLTGGGGYCTGGTGVHVGLSGSASGISYQLYTSTGTAGTAVPGTGTSIDFGLQTTADIRFAVATNPGTGCSDTMAGIVTVTINPLPAIDTVTGGGAYCGGGTGVHVGLNTSTTGTTYYVYKGSTLIDAASGTGFPIDFGLETAAGVYTVTATTIATTCTSNMFGSATVTVNPLPTLFPLTGGGSYCIGGSGVPVGLSNSTPGISYQLLLGGIATGAPVLSVGGAIAFGLQTAVGTYTVLATNFGSTCLQTMPGSVTVSVNPLPLVRTVTGGGSYCIGGTGVHVGVNISDLGINYQLYNTTPVGAARAGTGSALDYGLETATGTYTVIAQNPVTTCTVNLVGSVVVTTNPLPAIYPVTFGGSYCAGGTGVTVGLANSVIGTNYQLFIGGVPTGSLVAGTGVALGFGLQTAAGVYTVAATNSATLCTSNMAGSATVSINPLPTAFNVTGGGNYCTGAAGVHVGLSSSTAGVNYQLYVGGTAFGLPVAGTGSPLDFGTETASGTYTVIATNAITGCSKTMTGSVTVGISPLPAAFALTGGGGYCLGGTGVSVGLSNSVIGVNYQLYSSGLPVGPAQTGLGLPISFGLQTAGGSYTVVATTTATGCTNNMLGSAIVTVNPLPSIHTVTGGGPYCTGGTGADIILNGSDTGIKYQLYNGLTAEGTPVTGTGVALDFGLQTLTGNFTVTATNTSTSCTNNMAGTVNVSLYPLPVAYDVSGGGNYCAGGTGLHVGLSSSNTGVTYQLFAGMTPLGILAGTGLPLDFGLQTAVGIYTVVATNTTTLCTGNMSGAATITINPLPIVDTVTGGGNYCVGSTGLAIGLSGSDTGNTYELYYGGSSPVGLSMAGTGSALDFGLHLAAGTYTIKATATSTGCNDNMAGSAIISINPLPSTYSVTGGGNYCYGGSGIVIGLSSSDNGVSYQLYNGVAIAGSPVAGTGSAISFGLQTGAGTYTIVATNDTTYCTKNMISSAVIAINALPFAYTVTGGGNYCTGGSGVHIGLARSDSRVSYQLRNDGGSIGTPMAGTGSSLDFGLQTVTGSYTIVATNVTTGCNNTMSGGASVSYSTLPAVYALTSATSFYCFGGSGVDLALSGSDIGTNYQLYHGSTPAGLPIPGTGSTLDLGLQTGAGAYTVIATNAAGCVNTMIGGVSITINLPPIAYTLIGGGSYCAGSDGVHIGLNSSTIGISYQLYNGVAQVGGPMTGTGGPVDFGLQTATGSYTVIATNGATTCVTTMTGTATVTISPLPNEYTLTGGGNACMGGAGLHVGLSGSDGGILYKLYYGGAVLTTMTGTGAPLDFGLRTGGGDYTVVAENTTTGCTNNMAGTATITINSLPTPYMVTGGGNFCAGGTGVHIGLLSSNTGIVYQLFVGSTAVGSPTAGTGSAIDFGLQTLPGSYTVTATNTSTTCTNNMTGRVTVGINPVPVAYGVIGGGNYCTGGTGASVGLANSTTSVSYQLMYGSIPAGTPVVGTGSAINFGLETGIGSYTVVASNLVTACSDVMLGSATVGVSPLVAPSVTLSSGLGDTLCAGTVVSVTTLAANGGLTPTYQWYVNGMPVSAVGSSYVSVPSNGDSISVVMTSSEACATPASVSGSLRRLAVLPHALPTISITSAPGNVVCEATTVNFVASTTFGGTAPILSWTVNGVSEGIDSVYSYIPGNHDVVICNLTSDYFCRLATTVSSNHITMVVDPAITPSVSVSAHPGPGIAPGEYVLLTAIDANNAASPTYQWYINGTPIPGATDNTYTNNNFMDMDSISCVVASGGVCAGLSGSGSLVLYYSSEGVTQVTTTGSDVKLVPNPNNGFFTVKGTLGTTNDEQVSLEISDMLGQVIYKDNFVAHGGNINEKIQLSSATANGMYLLSLHSGTINNVFHVVIEQ